METQNKIGQRCGMPTILFGILLVALLFLAECAICSFRLECLQAYWDMPAFLFVLLGVSVYVFFQGRQDFITGIQTIFYCPAGNQKIAAYFRGLTAWTLGVGLAGMILGTILGVFFMYDAEHIGYAIAPALTVFLYAGWAAVIVFLPISIRFSTPPENTENSVALPVSRWFPIVATLTGIAALFLIRFAMALVIIAVTCDATQRQPMPIFDYPTLLHSTLFSLNPASSTDNFVNYVNPAMWWDLPSLLLMLISFLAFRLAAGPLRNRLDWIPVCILVGVLWSIDGFVIMLCDFDSDLYAPGCFVALLPAFYSFIAAPLVVLDKKSICRKTALVVVVLAIGSLLTWFLLASIGIIKE